MFTKPNNTMFCNFDKYLALLAPDVYEKKRMEVLNSRH